MIKENIIKFILNIVKRCKFLTKIKRKMYQVLHFVYKITEKISTWSLKELVNLEESFEIKSQMLITKYIELKKSAEVRNIWLQEMCNRLNDKEMHDFSCFKINTDDFEQKVLWSNNTINSAYELYNWVKQGIKK